MKTKSKSIKIVSMVTLISVLLSIGGISTFAETGSPTFLALYGGDLNSSDVIDFRNKFVSYGWNAGCAYSVRGTVDLIKSAKNYNILYWSGHGLSDGMMSFYKNDGTYVDYPRSTDNTTPMHDRIGTSYTYYDSTNGYYGPTVWNGKLNWVVMAVCNQLSTPQNRNKWAMTMVGPHRVKGFMGYYSTAYDSPTDNNVVKKFADLCFTSVRKRPMFAWIEASQSAGQAGAGSLYHTINKNDTLTNITDNSIYIKPTFEMMKADNSVISDPFNGNYLYSSQPSMYSASATDASTQVLNNSDIVYDIIELSDTEKYNLSEDNVSKRTYDFIKFDLYNYVDVIEKVNAGLKDSILPNDAILVEVKPITTTPVNETNGFENGLDKITGYILSYGRKIDGIGVANNIMGDYINIFIDENGIYSIDKQWSKISKKLYKNNNVSKFNQNALISKATEYVSNILETYSNSLKAIVKSKANVYVRESTDSSKLVPAIEVTFEDYAGTVYVNILTGEIINK